MPNAHEQQGEQQGANDPADPGPTPGENQEGLPLGDDPVEAGDGEGPEEPKGASRALSDCPSRFSDCIPDPVGGL